MSVLDPYVQIFIFMVTKAIPFIVFCSLLLVAIVVIPLGIYWGLLWLLDRWEDKQRERN